jgi:PLP dependent protein
VIDSAQIAGRLGEVESRIAEACRRAGRDPAEVRLIGVTKGVPADAVRAAREAGLRDLGENYVQELELKRAAAPDATWHFIGRLQRNKVRDVLDHSAVVHTLEPGRAADRLARIAEETEEPVAALIEVDFTGARVGVVPEELAGFAEVVSGWKGIRLMGLMTVPPQGRDARPYFAKLRALRDGLGGLPELSMGMSTDYEEAVEEGATMVRIGTAIFGPRPEKTAGAGL